MRFYTFNPIEEVIAWSFKIRIKIILYNLCIMFLFEQKFYIFWAFILKITFTTECKK